MGKVNVYLPDELERAVREAGVPISSVCQDALRKAVDAVAALRDADDLSDERLTPRLRTILASGPATALELLGAIILHGENLGARVLTDLGVELPPPRRPASGTRTNRRQSSPEVRAVLASAYRVALDLHHNYLGAEHVVIALAHAGSPTAELFAALGLDERAVRARVVHLLANPWRLDRFEQELERLTAELAALRSSAKLGPWPPTTPL